MKTDQVSLALCLAALAAAFSLTAVELSDDRNATQRDLPKLEQPTTVASVEQEAQPTNPSDPTKPTKPTNATKPTIDSVDPVTGITAKSSTVIMVSTPGCGPCERWWSEHSLKLKQAGWRVERTYKHLSPVNSYPTFRIFPARRWYTFTGPITMTQLREIIRKDSD